MVDKTHSSGKQKAAIMMMMLGEDLATEVFKRLDDEAVQEISREISLMGHVSADTTDRVVEEFYNMSLANEYLTVGGLDYAKKILIKALGPEEARKIIDRLSKILEKSAGFSSLEKVNPQQLSKFIQNEHPQTIALILAHLSASQAAELIKQQNYACVIHCPCRSAAALDGAGCGKPTDVCMHFGNLARFFVEKGYAREINLEQALAILDETDKAGLIHMVANSKEMGVAMCSCCTCCCR